ncbi:beta-N-acetylhexosaminidase [Sneathiella chinensis]|uniref:beta-N-acetylhexosaminidase n=1 Tax=Sneathiella chinensis TaxID=349750 RepID=A0ABQ5U880_9PROT|nr:beta-N-acetylhexosaminidase [Sneathiella chinensis]GLQ07479.1 beta-hexosaminidase [Sneathiella chinensis]
MPKSDFTGTRAVIFSCAGLTLTPEEVDFFRAVNPVGLVLFARNIDTPDQVRALINSFREAVGRPGAPVLVDQEGGRVQRLRPPHWHSLPSFGALGAVYAEDPVRGERAVRLATRIIAAELASVGFSVDCSPCLDLSLGETSSVIGDRSFSGNPDVVATLGAFVAEEFLAAGILPVIKHMPGHGRGTVDSHLELPVVPARHSDLSASDFVPFRKLSHVPWGMTAHIVYQDIDPDNPATQSRRVIEDVIRGEIGFGGVLLSDDLNMEALQGSLASRAARSLEAGVDLILHCSGKMDEMKEVAGACGAVSDETLRRLDKSLTALDGAAPAMGGTEDMMAELQGLLAGRGEG